VSSLSKLPGKQWPAPALTPTKSCWMNSKIWPRAFWKRVCVIPDPPAICTRRGDTNVQADVSSMATSFRLAERSYREPLRLPHFCKSEPSVKASGSVQDDGARRTQTRLTSRRRAPGAAPCTIAFPEHGSRRVCCPAEANRTAFHASARGSGARDRARGIGWFSGSEEGKCACIALASSRSWSHCSA
jgi:hypothetical protein